MLLLLPVIAHRPGPSTIGTRIRVGRAPAPRMTPTSPQDHAGVTSNRVDLESGAVLVGDGVHLDTAVRALGGDIFVHRIPCDALDVVGMIGDFANASGIRDGEDARGVVRAAGEDVFSCR